MATRETQQLILETALELFNKLGTKAVSTNRIADACAVSRGNLHYHFRTKEEIIQTIYLGINKEMDASWYRDHLEPTMEKMHFMFVRQIKMIWRYRFFYRELNSLLLNDPELKRSFMVDRKKRYLEVERFFNETVKAGLMVKPKPPVSMASILTISWLITDQWLAHLDLFDYEVDEQSIGEGFDLIMHLLDPYLTDQAKETYRSIGQEN